MILPSKN